MGHPSEGPEKYLPKESYKTGLDSGRKNLSSLLDHELISEIYNLQRKEGEAYRSHEKVCVKIEKSKCGQICRLT